MGKKKMIYYNLLNGLNSKYNYKRSFFFSDIVAKAEMITSANVDIDQYLTFEAAMKLFKREVNNSNIVNEAKRRRYHEKAWLSRRRKEKERLMKAKFHRKIMTYHDKNPLIDNNVFALDSNINDKLLD